MTLPPSDVIYYLLVGENLAGEEGEVWPLYIAFLPDDIDDAIQIVDTAGKNDAKVMRNATGDGEVVTHPGIQVRVRGRDYLTTYAKAKEIALFFDKQKRRNVIVDGESYRIDNISRPGDIVPMGVEDAGDRRRHHFAINVLLTVSEQT